MSEPPASTINTEVPVATTVTEGNPADEPQPAPKRRRRASGWDVPAATAPAAPVPATSALPLAQPQILGAQPATPLVHQNPAAAAIAASLAQQLALKARGTGGVGSMGMQAPKPGCRIYIGSINYDLKETDIVMLFSSFGTVTKSEMSMDPATGKSKGFCFIEYADAESAQAAMAMDGFDLAGRKIKVGLPHHTQSQQQQAAAVNPINLAMSQLYGNPALAGTAAGGAGVGAGALAQLGLGLGGQPVTAAPVLPVPQVSAASVTTPAATAGGATAVTGAGSAGTGDTTMNCVLVRNVGENVGSAEIEAIFGAFGKVVHCSLLPAADNVAGAGKSAVVEFGETEKASLTATSMDGFDLANQKLSCEVISKGAAVVMLADIPSAATTTKVATPHLSTTATSVLLENMVTMDDVSDPDLRAEIAEEAGNYGTLLPLEAQSGPEGVELLVDRAKSEVRVRLRYTDNVAAVKAYKAMNGRTFAGNKISALLE